MNSIEKAQALVADLEGRMAKVEELGALVAAAHLQAAIDALRRQFGSAADESVTD